MGRTSENRSDIFHFAGCRYRTSTLPPAFEGMTPPHRLRLSGCSSRWLVAVECLVVTLYHRFLTVSGAPPTGGVRPGAQL